MEFYGLGNYQLRIIQGTQSDSLMLLNNELSVMTTSRESERHQVAELSSQVNKLNNQLSEYTRYESLSKEIRLEISTLFPEIKSLSISRVAEVFSDTATVSHHVVAIIDTSHDKPLPKAEAHKLREWLQTRVKADSLFIVNSKQ